MVTRCIVDRGILEDLGEGIYRCSICGLWYARELLAEADREEWERITNERLYCLDCDQALPGLPRIHVNAQGEPIPCPIHDPRSWKRLPWWRRMLRRV